ncbi:MAG TPA: hypothetical protein VF950_24940 [Planctomycetota bacterium]
MKLQLCLLLAALSGCSPKPPPPPAKKPAAAIKKEAVTLEGTAQNAKAGAVLKTSDKTVSIHGLAAWPADVVGKRLTLKGELHTVPPPPATLDPMGNLVQSVLTTQYVLHDHSKVE